MLKFTSSAAAEAEAEVVKPRRARLFLAAAVVAAVAMLSPILSLPILVHRKRLLLARRELAVQAQPSTTLPQLPGALAEHPISELKSTHTAAAAGLVVMMPPMRAAEAGQTFMMRGALVQRGLAAMPLPGAALGLAAVVALEPTAQPMPVAARGRRRLALALKVGVSVAHLAALGAAQAVAFQLSRLQRRVVQDAPAREPPEPRYLREERQAAVLVKPTHRLRPHNSGAVVAVRAAGPIPLGTAALAALGKHLAAAVLAAVRQRQPTAVLAVLAGPDALL